jgi:hypothetical protein
LCFCNFASSLQAEASSFLAEARRLERNPRAVLHEINEDISLNPDDTKATLRIIEEVFFPRGSVTGLPDGIFSNQKDQFGSILYTGYCNGRCMYILWLFGLSYGHLVFVVAIWYTYFMVIWYIFSGFGILYQEKSGNPDQ